MGVPIDMKQIQAKIEAIRQRQEERIPFVDACRRSLEQNHWKEETQAAIEAHRKRRAERLAARGLTLDIDSSKINNDEDKWLTAKNGKRFLLGEGGEIKAGFGGKFTGMKPNEAFGEKSQPKGTNTAKKTQQTAQTNSHAKTSSASQNASSPVNATSISRSGHVTAQDYFGNAKTEQEMVKVLSQNLSESSGKNISPEEANKMWDAVSDYTGSHYKEIRKAYSDPKSATKEAKEQLEKLEDFIEASPKWDGAELYRGINVPASVLQDFTQGKVINMKGPSSWSDQAYVADAFASMSGDERVIFKLPKTNKGVSVTHLSSLATGEGEVLAPGNTQYVVKSVKQQKKRGSNRRVYNIELEEI